MDKLPIKILVIENHIPFANLLKEILQRGPGSQIIEANCLRAAFALLADSAPEIVILDLDLLDTWGIQAISRIRQMAPQTRIICLNEDEQRYNQAAFLQGAQACVRKEFIATDLVPAVVQVLSN